MFGRLVHYGFDALLISAFLAGIKRSTGLTPRLSNIPNKDVRRKPLCYAKRYSPKTDNYQQPPELLRSYLEVGEYAFDLAVVFFGRSPSFERSRSG
ncbi:uncharacterized protein EI90DRAFT_3116289 [Cantharellus anzutake]|uniref:uncharacterized protein n=1 Tax=Cantharellus anzutake TaxID=1750568 RepID=UPI00190513E5|nr:uncharacterized protein EI90DRAFT_3116289 [Cantharellus anzutake]KAF8342339.1 hypothetical protein EI90DRAFT_3116289 [Cantharellus anzutake]